MKIIKFGLPFIAIVALGAFSADQKLIHHMAATADAGALPETKVIADKVISKSLDKNFKKRARLAAR